MNEESGSPHYLRSQTEGGWRNPYAGVSEGERISKLYEYEILDSEKNRFFEDAITMLRELTGSPFAKIAFIDRNRIWFKSAIGINVSQSGREGSPELYALAKGSEFLAIPNIREVKQIWNSAFLSAHPDITSMAMVPILVQQKFVIGYVTILDTYCRDYDEAVATTMTRIARQITDLLEEHRQKERLQEEIHKQESEILIQFAVDRVARMLLNRIENKAQLDEAISMFAQGILNEFGWWAAQAWIATEGEFQSSQWLLSTATPPNLLGLAHMSPASHRKFEDAVKQPMQQESNFFAIQEVPWHPHRDILERQGVRGLVQADVWQGGALRLRLVFVIPKIATFSPAIQDALSRLLALLPPLFQRVQTSEELAFRASHDELTGLLNRRGLENSLPELAPNLPGQPHRSAFFLDLDRFKEVNDSHGHAVGDELLSEVANRIKESSRPVDVIARLGGDEFLIIGEGFESTLAIAGAATRLLEAISRPFTTASGTLLSPKASIGIAAWKPGQNLTEAIEAADFQMYQAKAQGGNSYALAEEPKPLIGVADRGNESQFSHSGVHAENGDLIGIKLGISLPNYLAPATMHALAESIGRQYQRNFGEQGSLRLFLDFPVIQRSSRANVLTLIASLHHYQSINSIYFLIRTGSGNSESLLLGRELESQGSAQIAIADFGSGSDEFALLKEFNPEYIFLTEAINEFVVTMANAISAAMNCNWVLPSAESLVHLAQRSLSNYQLIHFEEKDDMESPVDRYGALR